MSWFSEFFNGKKKEVKPKLPAEVDIRRLLGGMPETDKDKSEKELNGYRNNKRGM